MASTPDHSSRGTDRRNGVRGFWRRVWRRRPRLLWLVVALSIPFLLAVWLLGSEGGRLALTRGGIAVAERFVPDLSFSAKGLASRELGHWYFDRLQVHYGERTLASAESLTLHIDLHALMQKRIHLPEVSAGQLLFDNAVLADYSEAHPAPNVPESIPENQEARLSVPAIWVEKLSIGKLTIIDPQLDGLPVVSVKGEASYRWPGRASALQLKIDELDGKALSIRLDGEMQREDLYVLDFAAEEQAGGFLSRRLQLPEGQALDADGKLLLKLEDDNHLQATIERFNLPLVAHQFGLSGSADIEFSPWSVNTEGLDLTVDDTEHRISGTADGESLNLKANFDRLPIAISQPWQDYLQGGWLSADLEIVGPLKLPAVSGALEVRTRYQQQPLHLTAEVRSEDKQIRIDTAHLEVAEAALGLAGRVDIGAESIDLNARIEQLPVAKIRALLAGFEQTRAVEIPPDLDGTVAALVATASGPWKNPQMTLQLDGDFLYRDFAAELHGAVEGNLEQLTIGELLVEGEGLRVSGTGDVNIERESLQLQLDLAARDFQPAERLGLPVDEGTRVDMDAVVGVTGPWKNPEMSAQISSDGNYRDYRYRLRGGAAGNAEEITLDRLRLDLFRGSAPAQPRPRQSLVAEAVPQPQQDYPLRSENSETPDGVAALAADAEAEAQRGNAWLELNGVIAPKAQTANGSVAGRNIPLSLAELAGVSLPPSLNGELSLDGQFSGPFSAPEASVNLIGLGSFRGEPWHIQGDASYRKGQVDLADVKLLWAARNQLTASGSLSEQSLDLDLRAQANLADFDEWVNMGISERGELSLWATAAGTPREPQLAGELKMTGRAPGLQDDALVYSPLNLLLKWQTQASDLTVDLNASHGSRQAAQASASLAIGPILERLFAGAGDDAPLPLRLNAEGNADLAAVGAFIDPEIHTMRGRLDFNFNADGNTRAPNMRGKINLQDGYYEHRPTNTRLRSLVFVADLSPEQWRIVEAGARDKDKGRIDLTGAVTFNAPAPPQLDFVLHAKGAHLLNMPAARGAFTGELTLDGSTEDARLAGKMALRPLAVQIEHFFGSSVPEIDVVEVEVESDDGTEESGPSLLENIELALEIVLDQQSYVRGLGLDSELQGAVSVGGTAADPQASGTLTIVRGKFDLLGKKFELQDGEIQFQNNVAAIYIKGVYTHAEGEITAEISGTSDDPQVKFSSEPAAAQDEIFAQLLFGKSLTDISPLQAIRLVTVARALQGGGGGFDPMAKTRDLIGLDTLDVESEETDTGEDQYALSLGKYITSRIYLELQRSTDPLNPWQAEMQVELRKNLRLDIKSSDSDESSAGSIELQWKKDY
ncbi:translocation/assembly module TamB domain-containing protein [Microbulbifer sp.]|uniref:translocation/assembly module TamB domain-containing protein n=1 Tax=Microbulbifer sp. TaxID=1908541 RepID=UPI00258A9177|nr:translocation/assembly module TamB domain-containing protein [Microbulbifer sp.]